MYNNIIINIHVPVYAFFSYNCLHKAISLDYFGAIMISQSTPLKSILLQCTKEVLANTQRSLILCYCA